MCLFSLSSTFQDTIWLSLVHTAALGPAGRVKLHVKWTGQRSSVMIIVFQKCNLRAGIEWQGCLDKEFGIWSIGHASCFMPTYSSQKVCHSGCRSS